MFLPGAVDPSLARDILGSPILVVIRDLHGLQVLSSVNSLDFGLLSFLLLQTLNGPGGANLHNILLFLLALLLSEEHIALPERIDSSELNIIIIIIATHGLGSLSLVIAYTE